LKKELLIGVSTIPGQFIIPGLLKEIIQISDIAKQFISFLKSRA
jgi:hypothetical protein